MKKIIKNSGKMKNNKKIKNFPDFKLNKWKKSRKSIFKLNKWKKE